ncbi:hypothetical protein MPSI1_000076 [Malassezia psittaci]|uniref:Delta(3,5)-Delta(2,4)-dienoyl-CoA isomerase, mitochondrial n=1 Tax=Malassezia psittaci TaxID=1821823 RepID=A0AAF0F7I2_9BASI|nr:hypothetical protein MPSI1_000076 [Malassezia psittaci]
MSYPAVYKNLSGVEYFSLEWLAPNVLGVAINRPPVNAFHVAMWKEMQRIFRQIKLDGEIRAVVLHGNGRCFTAGLDLLDASLQEALNGEDPARISIQLRDFIDQFQNAITSIEICERPVIGVAHGSCIGLAIDILSATDIRYTAADAQFSIREAAIGLAADIGTLQRFPKIVGNDSVARELAYTARFFDAKEAKEIGFVSKVLKNRDEALQDAINTAKQIAQVSPVAVTGTKQAMVYSRDHTVAEGLQFMGYMNAALLQTEDVGNAIQAIMSKTSAKFAKL